MLENIKVKLKMSYYPGFTICDDVCVDLYIITSVYTLHVSIYRSIRKGQ